MLAPRVTFGGGVAVVMARKRKTAAERLRQEIERVRSPYDLRKVVRLTERDWTDAEFRGAFANGVLTLDGEPPESPLRKAFEKFDLDPIDPFNWRRLLKSLAAAVFPPAVSRPRGARPKWDERRRMLFEADVASARKRLKQNAKRLGLPPPANDDVAAYLRDHWPDRYRSISEASMRKYIVSGPPKGRL